MHYSLDWIADSGMSVILKHGHLNRLLGHYVIMSRSILETQSSLNSNGYTKKVTNNACAYLKIHAMHSTFLYLSSSFLGIYFQFLRQI